jgi:hypothetical protein
MMKFITHWKYPPENRDAIQARFKKTGGSPPDGIKMIGRWHRIGGGEGFCVSTTEDAQAIGKWAQDWSDLMTLEVYPVLEDEGVAQLIP